MPCPALSVCVCIQTYFSYTEAKRAQVTTPTHIANDGKIKKANSNKVKEGETKLTYKRVAA